MDLYRCTFVCQSNAPVKEIRFLVEAGGVSTLSARNNRGALPLHALSSTC